MLPDLPPIDPAAFLWFLPLTAPIAVWVAWSDMARMKIPNQAVVALAAVWLISPLVLPWQAVLWGVLLMAVVLLAGFLLNMIGLVGAGDAKFAAAMAPFFTGADPRAVMLLYAACGVAALAVHRTARAIPSLRAATPDWRSWTSRKFPFGLSLAGLLIIYPVLALFLPR